MKNKISNLLALPILAKVLFKAFRYQKQFIQKTIDFDIEEIKKENDNSLSDEDFKRILEHCIVVPIVIGEAICILRGKSMTLKERTAITYLAASTGLFDDFFDHKNTSEIHIKNLIDNPIENNATDSHEKLFIRFYIKALENCAHINLLKKSSYMVYELQLLSKKQKNSTLELDELKQLTYKKGAAASIIYRITLGDFESKAEELMIYKLGSLLQLEDDLFDIYIDYKNGIKTLATTEISINNFKRNYTAIMEEVFALVHQTEFRNENKKKFIRFISVFISRGFVCLDCLEKNEKRTNNIFSIKDYTRNELICDMEKPKNIFKWVNYYLKYTIEQK